MERLTVCRMCLNASVIYPIKDSQLQEVYEKLTSVTNTLKPLLICCICRAQLRKTRRLMIQCLKTEELLTQMLNQQLVTEDEIQQQSLKITHANITPFLTIAIVGHISIEGTSAEVKEEIPIITHEKDAKYVTIKTERLEDIPQLADDTHRGSNNTNRNHEQTPSETAKAISLKYKYLKSETVSNKGIKNRVTKKDRIGRRKAVPIAQKSKTATQNRKIGEYDTESVLDDLRQCKLSQNNNKISESGTKDCNIDACSGNKTQFVCDICSKDFDCRRKLTRHIRLHTDEKQHVCNICYKRFTQLINLKSHLRIHTGERPYACKLCDKRFTQLSSLTTHRLLHTGERPHLCKICDKRFTQVSNLKKHARTHSGEKPYACNVCDKRFSDKSDLKKHALIHTGERRYTCGVCDKRFTEKGALKTHVRIHTDEKPYICNTCDKRFTQKSNLRLHTRVHTGEKPYTCRVCNKKFTGKNDLTRHERIHTGEKPYLCDICAMTFRRPSAVKSHLKLHKCNT